MKYKVKFTTFFVAAHRLLDHPGRCSQPHGHNYTVSVEVMREGGGLDEKNMVIDYYVLRKTVEEVLDQLDHADLNTIVDKRNPTSEKLAEYLAKRIEEKLGRKYRVTRIEVCETPDFCAVYEAD